MLEYKHTLTDLVSEMDYETDTDPYRLGPITLQKVNGDYQITIDDTIKGIPFHYSKKINEYADFELVLGDPMTFEQMLDYEGIVRFVLYDDEYEVCTEPQTLDEVLADLINTYYPEELRKVLKRGKWYKSNHKEE